MLSTRTVFINHSMKCPIFRTFQHFFLSYARAQFHSTRHYFISQSLTIIEENIPTTPTIKHIRKTKRKSSFEYYWNLNNWYIKLLTFIIYWLHVNLNVFCVYTSFSEYVLGWFSPVLFIATHGEQMYTIGRNASQTHVLFCDFFQTINMEII
jgi:hypothetical protein